MMKTTTPTTMVSQMRQAFGQDGFCGAIIAVLLTDWTARVTQKKTKQQFPHGCGCSLSG